MWLLDKFLKRVIREGQLIVTDHDGKTYRYGDAASAPLHIRLTHRKAASHIARYPQLGAGEAYMWGWLKVEEPHDIRDMILFVTQNSKRIGDKAIQSQSLAGKFAQKVVAKLDGINLRGSARKNAEHTYNLTRQLYERFLDEDRQYTMAYYREDPENTSLEQAQMDKKAHIASKLYLQQGKSDGMRVLDIGCGWGGFALYLHQMYGVEVLRISSVGLLEHVGTIHYPQFYEHTFKLLADDGVMVSHCCGRAGPPGHTDAWTRKYIFPGGYIPALSELVSESEKAGWQVMDVEAMRFHYSHTLEEWYNRTVQHRAEIVDMYDETFYRMWLYYLAGAEQSFRHGDMVNWQLIYVKDRSAIPMTREWITEESARLRAADADKVPEWRFAQREAAE